MRFFPFVFSLFMFILVANLLGLFPYFFTVTNHIIVTCLRSVGSGDWRGAGHSLASTVSLLRLFAEHASPQF